MVHAYSLIHDDLPAMDDDDLRRGRPTCHKQFDEATAILAGDALLTLAFETLADGVKPPAVAAACCAALAKAAGACGMVGGQMDDVAAEKNDECGMMSDKSNGHSETAGPSSIHHSSLILHHSYAALESIHRRKTGAMIRVSLEMGATVAGGDSVQLAALNAYGQRLGLAFQIIDDLLDVQSSVTATGKRVGKDAQRGKLTFPGLLGLDQSTQHARELISEASEALELFGEEADGLRAVAHFVLERNR
jgi:geranylgeranyl diphosphate synthase type II